MSALQLEEMRRSQEDQSAFVRYIKLRDLEMEDRRARASRQRHDTRMAQANINRVDQSFVYVDWTRRPSSSDE